MKLINYLFMFLFAVFTMQAQVDYTISFTGAEGDTTAVTLDSVTVENLTQVTVAKVYGTAALKLGADIATVISPQSQVETQELSVYPNPMTTNSTVSFFNQEKGRVSLSVYSLSGQMVFANTQVLGAGTITADVAGLGAGNYIISASTSNQVFSGKISSVSNRFGQPTISFSSDMTTVASTNKVMSKSAAVVASNTLMNYAAGDQLLLVGYSGNYSTVVPLVATEDSTVNFALYACTDSDGNHYPTVKVSNQVWMAKNLNTKTAADGTDLGFTSDSATWADLSGTTKAACYYNYSVENGEMYGALYNWYAMMNDEAASDDKPSGVQGICPTGWHLPGRSEFAQIDDAVDETYSTMGQSLRTTSGWTTTGSTYVGDGTDIYGFSALPGGYRTASEFADKGVMARWWLTKQKDDTKAYNVLVQSKNTSIDWGSTRYSDKLTTGFSVRCIKD